MDITILYVLYHNNTFKACLFKIKMADNLYQITASGSTTADVERSLGSQRGGLAKKFQDAGVSPSIEIAKRHYEGKFSLKGRCRKDACTTRFTVKSDTGLEAVNETAENTVGGAENLRAYNVAYRAEQGLRLTAAQQKALKPKDTGAAIGYEQNLRNQYFLGNIRELRP